VFGYTGSLVLQPKEIETLAKYNINERNFKFYPSFYGGSGLIYNKKENITIEEDKTKWEEKVMERIKVNAKNKCVLVYFDSEEMVKDWVARKREELEKERLTLYFATQNYISDLESTDKMIPMDTNVFQKLIDHEHLGRQGYVCFMTKNWGRGVDFLVSRAVIDNQGGHVIQTFFSTDVKEEIQVQGRMARKNLPGSYELVLESNV